MEPAMTARQLYLREKKRRYRKRKEELKAMYSAGQSSQVSGPTGAVSDQQSQRKQLGEQESNRDLNGNSEAQHTPVGHVGAQLGSRSEKKKTTNFPGCGLRHRKYGIQIKKQGNGWLKDSRYNLIKCISERYSDALYVDGIPGRFCFLKPYQSPDHRLLFDINLHDMVHAINSGCGLVRLWLADYEKEWMLMDNKEKATLHRLLNIPENLWYHLKYDLKEDSWTWHDDEGDYEGLVFLADYGEPDATLSYNKFTERLIAEVKPAELDPWKSDKLTQRWIAALQSGLDTSEGHTAIFQLFDELTDILQHMDLQEISPVVEVIDTRTAIEDLAKKPSPSGLFGDITADESFDGSKERLSNLAVISLDEDDNVKYLAIIGTSPRRNSNSKTDPQTQHQFLKEVLFALQSQDSVFGFLFSNSDVMYYYARKDENGDINIEQFRYPIARLELYQPEGGVHVGAFQMLIMDLLASLLCGLNVTPQHNE